MLELKQLFKINEQTFSVQNPIANCIQRLLGTEQAGAKLARVINDAGVRNGTEVPIPNPFLSGSADFLNERWRQEPSRWYAHVSEVYPLPEGGYEYQFGAVNADWFDDDRWYQQRADDPTPISIITMPQPEVINSDGKGIVPQKLQDGGWRQLTFNPSISNGAVLFRNLFEEGIDGDVRVARVHKTRIAQLKKFVSVDAPEASLQEIDDALDIQTVAAVAVYDVGQGNCNALLDDAFTPILYYDFGGGVLRDKQSFPAHEMTDFCYCRARTVVLSHWDWDHWSSARRFPHAMDLLWIAPKQDFSAVHAEFARDLVSRGRLRYWPKGNQSHKFGRIEIRVGSGSSKNRNNSGLALIVDGPDEYSAPILLTGDAQYSAILPLAKEYDGLIASHHGGRLRGKTFPTPSKKETAKIAYSYGLDNYFQHVLPNTRDRHEAAGWVEVIETTRARRPHHLGLSWKPSIPALVACCAATVDIVET